MRLKCDVGGSAARVPDVILLTPRRNTLENCSNKLCCFIASTEMWNHCSQHSFTKFFNLLIIIITILVSYKSFDLYKLCVTNYQVRLQVCQNKEFANLLRSHLKLNRKLSLTIRSRQDLVRLANVFSYLILIQSYPRWDLGYALHIWTSFSPDLARSAPDLDPDLGENWSKTGQIWGLPGWELG